MKIRLSQNPRSCRDSSGSRRPNLDPIRKTKLRRKANVLTNNPHHHRAPIDDDDGDEDDTLAHCTSTSPSLLVVLLIPINFPPAAVFPSNSRSAHQAFEAPRQSSRRHLTSAHDTRHHSSTLNCTIPIENIGYHLYADLPHIAALRMYRLLTGLNRCLAKATSALRKPPLSR